MEDNAQAENAAQYRFFRRRNKINPEASSNALTGKKVEEDDYNDDIYLEERLDVPEPDGTLFSWRKLWLFTGPGWLSKQLYVHLWITFILFQYILIFPSMSLNEKYSFCSEYSLSRPW